MKPNARRILMITVLLLVGLLWFFLWGPGNDKISPWTKGDFFYAIGSYQSAIDAYGQALLEDIHHPQAGEATYRIARSLQIVEVHDQALSMYQSFVTLYPNHRRIGDAKNQIAKYQLETGPHPN